MESITAHVMLKGTELGLQIRDSKSCSWQISPVHLKKKKKACAILQFDWCGKGRAESYFHKISHALASQGTSSRLVAAASQDPVVSQIQSQVMIRCHAAGDDIRAEILD